MDAVKRSPITIQDIEIAIKPLCDKLGIAYNTVRSVSCEYGMLTVRHSPGAFTVTTTEVPYGREDEG